MTRYGICHDGRSMTASEVASHLNALGQSRPWRRFNDPRNGVERVVLCGVYSHMVVDSTARHADDSGLIVTVLEDCCASADPEVHRVEMEKILPVFGSVTTMSKFLGELN